MVELTIEGDLAVFRVVSWYRRWAIASLREVHVPLAHIHGARHERPPSPLMKGWTNLGCWIRGVITFGSYQVHGERHWMTGLPDGPRRGCSPMINVRLLASAQ
jgi:hypothetical protein